MNDPADKRPALVRLLHLLAPERAHALAMRALETGLFPAPPPMPRDERLAVRCCGLDFPNPLGLAAGFDKNARATPALLALGFGFVEVGTITPLAQPGNAPPRLFRLPRDEALVNRLGFNNEGHAAARARLKRQRAMIARRGIVGVNIGANKKSLDRVADYAHGARAFADIADYLTINISSPNTPGLRELQREEELARLLRRIFDTLYERPRHVPPVFVKIAPDISADALAAVVEVAVQSHVKALIISNTTTARPPHLKDSAAREVGGLSGRPLFTPSTRMLARAFHLAKGRLALVGCGGIFSGEDAWQKIRAGATLLQLYTGFVYRGPALVGEILEYLGKRLREEGFSDISQAVGSGAQDWLDMEDMRENTPGE